ncbi:MAG: hypothetical protein WCT77_04270 [Bacteroidota bacterium]|jgi:hypothetical protein
MNEKKQTDGFDCLEYKYKVQEKIYQIIKNFNAQEEKEYFNNKARTGSFGYLFKPSSSVNN